MNKKFARRATVVSLLVIFGMLLSGCQAVPAAAPAATGGDAGAGELPTTLVVASFYPVDQVSGWDGLVDAFTAKHPNVTIEVQVTPMEQYMPKLLSQIAAGDAPDIAGVENGPFPQFVERNMLTDLTPYLAATPGFATDDFFPHLIDRYTYEGNIYGIPYDAQPVALLYYNPALFDEAGVAYPTSDWTWEDARAAAKQLTNTNADGTVSQWGLALPVGENDPQRLFLYAWNGRFVDDLRNPTRSLLGEQNAIDAMQFMVDMMYEDKTVPTPATMESLGGSALTDLFTSGKAAMMINGFWSAVENPEGFKNIDTHVVMAPTGPDGNRLYATGGTAYTILNGSDNPDLAWEFITEFLGETGYQQAYQAATLGAIYPPAHVPSFDWYMSQEPAFVDTIQPNKDALQYIIFAPYPLTWSEIYNKCVTPSMDLIKRNSQPVAETMQAMAQCVDEGLQQ